MSDIKTVLMDMQEHAENGPFDDGMIPISTERLKRWCAVLAAATPGQEAVQPVEDIEGDLPDFNDDRVKTVYELLCAMDRPPTGEHWEGFVARKIVAALALRSASNRKGSEMLDIERLKLLARSATQGNWQFSRQSWNVTVVGKDDFGISVYEPESEADMTGEFIAAANPETILSLIAEIESLRAQLSAQSVSAVQPVAWATHHDEPMLFPTFKEAAMYCDDGEEPIALVPITHPADADAVDAKRYRWLCDGHGYFLEEEGLCGHFNEKASADAAIDAAMAQSTEGAKG